MDYFTTLREHMLLFWYCRNGKKVSHAKFVRCYLEMFLAWAATKISEKMKSVGLVSGARMYQVHKTKENTNNFSFLLKK
jgi:hypothetical protein